MQKLLTEDLEKNLSCSDTDYAVVLIDKYKTIKKVFADY